MAGTDLTTLDVAAPAPNGTDPPPRALPTSIRPVERFRPAELAALKAVTGKSLGDVQGDQTEMLWLLVWIALYRAGFRPTWEEAGEVEADMRDEPVDPTSGSTSTGSPGSAASGGAPPAT